MLLTVKGKKFEISESVWEEVCHKILFVIVLF